MNERRITAIVVDDSAVVRRYLSETLTAGGIEVIATAGDPLFAWPKMEARWPDVIVLDVEMPRMDGLTFLSKVMSERPTPVVMCSTLTAAGAATTLQALAEGAVAIVTKPKLGLRQFLEDPSNGLVAAVRAAAGANVAALGRRLRPRQSAAPPSPGTAPPDGAASAAPRIASTARVGALAETTDRVIALGASTGGVQAIEHVLVGLPRTTPGIVIVQHMPPSFTGAFAERLDRLCAMEIKEARDGDRVIAGRVLIAPGGRHMRLRRSGAQYLVEVCDGPLVNRHKPSVDLLFRTVALHAGANAVGVLLTGMGDDGARGLLEMRQAGARTAAQDESSCVVFGMPREAIKLGAAAQVLSLDEVSGWIDSLCSSRVATAP
jgi:two-component system chemotaxis response regulator CheB